MQYLNLTDLHTIRSLLKKHQLWAKRSLGQNFLLDADVIETACLEADLQSTDTVVEIGPGLGVLTQVLAAKAQKVIACEIDDDMIMVLDDTLSAYKNVEVEKISGLTYEPRFPDYKLVANIPYYITGKLLRHFLEEVKYRPSTIVLLVQKEVAQKVCADVGDMNLVALGVQVFGQPRYIRTVTAESFHPAPKVDSALLGIDVYDEPLVKGDLKAFFHLVNYCFRQKRKKLKTTLKGYAKVDAAKLQTLSEQYDLNKRPQELSIEDWEGMLNYLSSDS